jgi:hypothetical protein
MYEKVKKPCIQLQIDLHKQGCYWTKRTNHNNEWSLKKKMDENWYWLEYFLKNALDALHRRPGFRISGSQFTLIPRTIPMCEFDHFMGGARNVCMKSRTIYGICDDLGGF